MITPLEAIDRRKVLSAGGLLGLAAALGRAAPAYAWTQGNPAMQMSNPASGGVRNYDLEIDDYRLVVNGRPGKAMAINGTVPGPLLRFREGEEAIIRVTNRLEEIASIHCTGSSCLPAWTGFPA